MKKRLFALLLVFGVAKSSLAFAPWMVMAGAWLTEYIALPVGYALSCGLVASPPVRVFGTEENVYGLDWGSLACHARNVYGLQLAFCGGAVEHRLYGLQLGILASGYAAEELPLCDRHFFNTDFCHMNGLQFGTFAAKTARCNGIQLSAIYAEAQTVNGLQVGLVTRTEKLRGLQVGVYNSAERGCGAQIGLLNNSPSGLAGCLPVLNLVF